MNYCQFRNDVIKRMASAGGATPILPPEYQQVEWIENGGTGRCYILIGVPAPDTYHYIVDFEFVETIGGGIIGNDWDYGNARYAESSVIFNDATYGSLILFRDKKAVIPTIIANTKYRIEYCHDTEYRAELNRQPLAIASDTNNRNSSLILFTCGAGGGVYAKHCKLYSVVIMETYNGVELFRLIPCYRKSDNKPGMYNVVNNTFYAGAGSNTNPGTFILGQDV